MQQNSVALFLSTSTSCWKNKFSKPLRSAITSSSIRVLLHREQAPISVSRFCNVLACGRAPSWRTCEHYRPLWFKSPCQKLNQQFGETSRENWRFWRTSFPELFGLMRCRHQPSTALDQTVKGSSRAVGNKIAVIGNMSPSHRSCFTSSDRQLCLHNLVLLVAVT